jgi:hypothetical protein
LSDRTTDASGAPETIARYTAGLVHDLCAALEKRGLGARRLDRGTPRRK